MSDYKVLQVRSAVKTVIEQLAQQHEVSQSGLIAALVYTLEGRQNHGNIRLRWSSIQKEYPAPIKADRGEWKKSTKKLKNIINEYFEIEISRAAEEAEVDMRLVWTILSFLHSKGELVDHKKGRNLILEETTIILSAEERSIFDQALKTFKERKEQRKERNIKNKTSK